MKGSRGLAVIGAFALIVLAIFIRGLLVDGGGGGGSDGPSEKPSETATPVVACTPEVMAVCDALADAGSIAPGPPELDLGGAAEPTDDIDGWIAWNPAPKVANYRHSSSLSSVIWDGPEALGSAPESVLLDGATLRMLPPACRTSPTWACLAAAAPDLAIGVGDPATAEGLARIAPFARALAEDDDPQLLDAPALDAVVQSPVGGQRDAAAMARQLATQPGSVSIVAGPEGLLQRQTTTAAGKSRGLQVLTPSSKASLTLVLAPRAGRADELTSLACDDLPDGVTKAIRQLGLVPCTGSTDDALAGFLYQVQNKVG